MILTDAGPLVALIDADEPDHETCVLALQNLPMPMATTWPAFTEAMHSLCRAGGPTGRRALWKLVRGGHLVIADLPQSAIERSDSLMEKYADLPMDLADATLVATAEERNERRIFTLDSDFTVYRIHGRRSFDIVPSPR